jgi:hypothetical protein
MKLAIDEFPAACNAIACSNPGKSININDFQKMLGHCGSDRREKTAKNSQFKVKREFRMRKECAIATARQKNIKKEWKGGSQVPGEKI